MACVFYIFIREMVENTQLGNISGNLLLFGGVDSNYRALEQLVTASKEMAYLQKTCICTGDMYLVIAHNLRGELLQLFRMGSKEVLWAMIEAVV